jgi:hypothetical protein
MGSRRRKDRLYRVTVAGFLVGLVVVGLLGVPALLVAAIGAVVATLGIVAFHRFLEGGGTLSSRRRAARRPVPSRYVPSVLEQSSMRRRRGLHLRGHRHA